MTTSEAIERVRDGVPWTKVFAITPLVIAVIVWAVQAEYRTRANEAMLTTQRQAGVDYDARLRTVEARLEASDARTQELFRAVARIEGDVRQTTELQREILQRLSTQRE
jgi:hypothetical protein